RHQRSDHLFFRAVVEYTSPGRHDSHSQQTNHRAADACCDADHAGRVLALLDRRRARARTGHNSGAGTERRSIRGGERVNLHWPDLSMGGYGFYVWGSYVFSLVAILWELISLRQRRKAAGKEESSHAVRPTVLRGSTHETTS